MVITKNLSIMFI